MGFIGDEINEIQIINCHDHLQQPEDNRVRNANLYEYLRGSYVSRDFASAGLPPAAWLEPVKSPEEGWKRISPYLPKMHNTGFFRCMFGGLRGLFDFPHSTINDSNWRALSDQMEAANSRPDWYETVLQKKAKIEMTFLDMGRLEVDRRLFRSVMRVDEFQHGYNRRVFYQPPVGDLLWGQQPLTYGQEVIEKRWGQRIRTLDDLLGLQDLVFEKCRKAGIVAIKMCRAYERPLFFANVSKSEAERIFVKSDREVTPTESRAFEDFIMHETIRKTIEYDLPLHIHTGMQAGSGNYLDYTNPLHLNDLFLQYRDARFVLLHGSFPWCQQLGVLVKNNPNVFLDFSWVPQISPTVARRSLSEWLELVPSNKLVWGADVGHVEETYGTVLYLREILTEVLEEKVARDYFDKDIALEIARAILRDNPINLHGPSKSAGSRTADWPTSAASEITVGKSS